MTLTYSVQAEDQSHSNTYTGCHVCISNVYKPPRLSGSVHYQSGSSSQTHTAKPSCLRKRTEYSRSLAITDYCIPVSTTPYNLFLLHSSSNVTSISQPVISHSYPLTHSLAHSPPPSPSHPHPHYRGITFHDILSPQKITSAAPPPRTKADAAAGKQKRQKDFNINNKAAFASPFSRSAVTVEPASPSPSLSPSLSDYSHEVSSPSGSSSASGPPSASSSMTMMEQQPGPPGLGLPRLRSKRNYPSSEKGASSLSASGRMRATARAFVRGISIVKRDSRAGRRSGGTDGFEAV